MASHRKMETFTEFIYIFSCLMGIAVLVVLICCCRRSTPRHGEVLPPVRAAGSRRPSAGAQPYCRTVTVPTGHGEMPPYPAGRVPPFTGAGAPYSAAGAPYSPAGLGGGAAMPHQYSSVAPASFNPHAPPPSYEQVMNETSQTRQPFLPYSPH